MNLSAGVIICLVQLLASTKAEIDAGKYSVVAPAFIYSNSKYTVAVATHHMSGPCQMKVGITNGSYNNSKEVLVPENEVIEVDFDLPGLKKGDYKINAEGINCMANVRSYKKLIYNSNIYVRAYTDKGLYSPGDVVNFRILFITKDLKPAEPEKNTEIWFQDGKGNKIKAIEDLKINNGVYTGKFKISQYAVRGDWSFIVAAGARIAHATFFKVKNYVLPKYNIHVEPDYVVSVKDGELQVVIKAHHIYGKPLNGIATVVLSMESSPTLTKTVDVVHGQAKIHFNITEYEPYLHKINPSYILVEATVKEKYTGDEISTTAYTTIFFNRYTVNCVSKWTCTTFESGKEEDTVFHITNIDGSNLNDTGASIELIYTVGFQTFAWVTEEDTNEHPVSINKTLIFNSHMNETGFVNFKVSLPALPEHNSYSYFYSLEIKYRDELYPDTAKIHQSYQPKEIESPEVKKSQDDHFFVFIEHPPTNGLHVNEPEQFTLNSSQPLSYFDYNIISGHNILQSHRINLSEKSKVHRFILTPEFTWAPRFTLLCLYVDEKGTLHSTEHTYNLKSKPLSQINVTAPAQAQIGEEVTLKIQTTPNSLVALMAVDESSLVLQNNNDITASQLRWIYYAINRQSRYRSGCVILTNADYTDGSNEYVSTEISTPALSNFGYSYKDFHTMEVAKYPADTWLFVDINNENAELDFSAKIPESATNWIVTAFSMNPTTGLAINQYSSTIKTSKPISISTYLPYSVKKGEVINVPASVFNNLDEELKVEVVLEKSHEQYEFITFDNVVISKQRVSKFIRIPSKEFGFESFLIRPKVFGNIKLTLQAISKVAHDVLHEPLKVVPAGITQYINDAYFVNLTGESKFIKSFDLKSLQVVKDSSHIEVGVVGDILGPVFNNLDNLVRLPKECGDQIISNMLSNYLIMKHLQNSNRLTSDMESKLLLNLESGYQNILNYRHTDGSFSSFGPSYKFDYTRNGSTWLTAHVVRSLQQIKEYVYISNNVIIKGLEYLMKQQLANGTFAESVDYLYTPQSNHVTLASAAVLALLENATYAEVYAKELRKGIEFIEENVGNAGSLHAKAIGIYTLSCAKPEAIVEKLDKLKSLAKIESDHIWWSQSKRKADNNMKRVSSNDIEITSYALLALLRQQSTKIEFLSAIINWLIAQRNSYGGFSSTQGTAIGLMALVEYSKFIKYKPAIMNVGIEAENKMETISLTANNGLLYQKVEIPNTADTIELSATGNGIALVQIASQYNTIKTDSKSSFTITIANISLENQSSHLEMEVCSSYVGQGKPANMTVLEISTPSGYEINSRHLETIKQLRTVRNIELKNGNTLMIVYVAHLYSDKPMCVPVQAFRTHSVAKQKKAAIVLYDYYDNSKRVSAFYKAESTLCDICELAEECRLCK